MRVELPCGRCIGCRLERSRQWAVRCMHEAKLHAENCFITLTYNDESLPIDGSLHVEDWQKFIKRLRKRIGSQIRYFHCGEYGERLSRPHYHACLFGYRFPDLIPWQQEGEITTYRSLLLEELWSFGFSTVGDVTFESAAYVARYITKKQTGDQAEEHYQGLKPEYITMSRRPGIGSGFYEKFSDDIYPFDRVVVRDRFVCVPPRFYDKLHEKSNPQEMESIRQKRFVEGKKAAVGTERLSTMEKVQQLKLKERKRKYEESSLRSI